MNASLLLAIATLALVVGPLLERFARRQAWLAGLVDGMTVGGIVVVSLLHLMPESTAHLGLWAIALLLLGLLLPWISERALAHSWQGWRISVGALILVLFIGHLLVEGAALASTANNERLALATVIVVAAHNLPLGVLLWGQTRRRFGPAWSVAVLAAVGAITWFGPLLLPLQESTFSAACSALLAGGLLHLVLQHDAAHGSIESDLDHAGHGDQAPHAASERAGKAPARRAWAAVGAVAAFAVLLRYLGAEEGHSTHDHGGSHLPSAFLELFLETAPPLLLGVLAAAWIEAFLPQVATRWLARGGRLSQAMRGVAVGTPMPVCSCGVLPIYRALIQRGVPASAALALLVAAPEIGIDSLLLSFSMLGGPTTLARFAAALVLALVIGWFVGGIAQRHAAVGVEASGAAARPRGWGAWMDGLYETWAHLGPWILLGLFATVFCESLLVDDWENWAREIAPWKQVLLLAIVGMPSYICATAATPFAALLLIHGFTPGAVLAFLLTGPATNWTTFAALQKLHSTRVALAFAATALAVTCALGLAVDFALGPVAIDPPQAAEHGAGGLGVVCASVLCALSAWVLFRVGPRGFLSQLSPGLAGHSHDHGPSTPSDGHDHHDHPHGAGCEGVRRGPAA